MKKLLDGALGSLPSNHHLLEAPSIFQFLKDTAFSTEYFYGYNEEQFMWQDAIITDYIVISKDKSRSTFKV